MNYNKNLRRNWKNCNCLQSLKVVIRNKVSGAIAVPKASWGCAPALPNRIQVVFLRALPIVTVPPEQLQDICSLLRLHKAGRSWSPRLEKLSLFSPPAPCARRMAQGFRCLRAAIRATRPEPRQHFCKIAGAKNFLFACGSIFGNDASKENGLSHPAKGGSTPAFAYQRAAIAPLPCLNLQP